MSLVGKIAKFYTHEIYPLYGTAIQFIMEKESEEKVPFLDTLVEREESGMNTSVYRKPTSTDRYIQFNSNHQKRILRGHYVQ